MHGKGGVHGWVGMHGGGHVWWGTCVAVGRGWQEKKAIAAGGTHPTGMHSC